jgi:hypothetical protein
VTVENFWQDGNGDATLAQDRHLQVRGRDPRWPQKERGASEQTERVRLGASEF